MQRVLIPGGCGFIGSNLALAFRAAGAEVTVLDNLSRRGSEHVLRRVLDHGVSFQHGDIRNPEDWARAGGNYDLMIECSAEPSVLVGTRGADARFMVQNNLTGALEGLEWARAHAVPVLFLSTSRVYPYDRLNDLALREADTRFDLEEGGPGVGPAGLTPDFPLTGARSLYGATKLAAEIMLQEYAHQYDLPVLINRCGVVAGPWQMGKVDQGVFTYWLLCHRFNRPLRYIGFGGSGKQVRDFLHIDDLVELVMKQAARIGEFRGEVFHAGGSSVCNLSLREATELCADLTGHRVEVGSDPENRPADVPWLMMDNTATTAAFDWTPRRDARTTLADIDAWIRGHEGMARTLLG